MKIVPDAIVDDGLFDVCIIEPVPRRTVLRLLLTLFWGGHANHRAVQMHRTKSLTIETDPPILLYADGEPVCYTPATVEIIERGLNGYRTLSMIAQGGEATAERKSAISQMSSTSIKKQLIGLIFLLSICFSMLFGTASNGSLRPIMFLREIQHTAAASPTNVASTPKHPLKRRINIIPSQSRQRVCDAGP